MPIDIRDALRGFAKNRGFLAAAVLSLALGVGANTAIFSVASALILRPLPYPQADRLVILWNRSPGLGITEDWFSTAQYIDVRNNAPSLEQAGIAYGGNDNLTGDGEPERISTVRLSSNLLPLFGARAEAGRLFTAEDDTTAATPARSGAGSSSTDVPSRSSACCRRTSLCPTKSCRHWEMRKSPIS
jgi:hypothetical protein